jgi:hypothetical protein
VKAIDSTLLNSLRTNDPPLGVLKFFGAIEVFGLSARPMKRASGESLVLATKLIEKGDAIAKEWAADFNAVLNRWRAKPEAPYVLQLFRSAFPGLLRSLRSIKHQPWQEQFIRCLDSYVVSTRSTCFPIVGRHKFLTAIATQKTVANELGIRSERLGELLLQSQTSTTASRSTAMGRSRKYVDPTAVKQVADYLADRISITQAASHLEISSARVAKLISSKVLVRRNNWLSRDDVDRFRSSLSRLSQVSLAGEQSVTLGFALRNWVPVSATADFFQTIIEKRILIFIPQSPSNFSAWLVDGNTLRLWRSSLRQDIREFHSIPEAAIQLGYKQEVVYALVNHGLLRTSMQLLRKRSARCISQVELKKFQTTYVPLSTIAQSQRVVAKQSLEWARSQGMKLATGPLIDGSRQYFVKAKSVPPHMLP